ncbi:MAG: thioredoxin family protein [Bacteroidales bacterium]|nr:thioredoxin family protein [Bacteroidales bacterium]
MKRLSLLFAAIGLCMSMAAQIINPTHWTFGYKDLDNGRVELQLTVRLDKGWHLYSQHTDEGGPIATEFTFETNPAFSRIGNVVEPKPHEEYDELFGVNVRSFEGQVVFRQQIARATSEAFTVNGTVAYQLCNDGACIPPDELSFSIKVPAATPAQATAEAASPIATQAEAEVATEPAADSNWGETAAAQPAEPTTSTPTDNSQPRSQSLLLLFLGALGIGILTMFTPCVFPMIPMTVNYFLHSADNPRQSRRQAWFFGFSIVFIFAVLGALLTLLFGPSSLNFLATHWLPNLIFFAIFLTFSLSFFGLFEIRMPEKWINKSDAQADKGGWLAPFFMALTTVLVSFSCTGPIIGGALATLTTSDTNRWISLISMLGFGLGFALPFTLLAIFPSTLKNMKSGSWLNTVKVTFAFLELAFGLKFLQQADLYCGWGLLNRDIYLALWIVIFGLLGLYLLGKIHFKGDDPSRPLTPLRLFLAIATLSFTLWMVPGLWGAPLKSISGYLPPMDTQQFSMQTLSAEQPHTLPSERKYVNELHMPPGFEGFYDLEEAKAYARTVGKPILIDFTGRTCANCRKMEQAVWTNADVATIMRNDFVLCALYTDANNIELPTNEWVADAQGKTIKTLGRRNLNYQMSAFRMNAQPYYVIIDSDERVLTANNYAYNPDPTQFTAFLREALHNYRR